VALFATTGALSQLWAFWVAPLAGAVLGGAIWRFILSPGETLANVGQDPRES
jgi:aquaporin Z